MSSEWKRWMHSMILNSSLLYLFHLSAQPPPRAYVVEHPDRHFLLQSVGGCCCQSALGEEKGCHPAAASCWYSLPLAIYVHGLHTSATGHFTFTHASIEYVGLRFSEFIGILSCMKAQQGSSPATVTSFPARCGGQRGRHSYIYSYGDQGGVTVDEWLGSAMRAEARRHGRTAGLGASAHHRPHTLGFLNAAEPPLLGRVTEPRKPPTSSAGQVGLACNTGRWMWDGESVCARASVHSFNSL